MASNVTRNPSLLRRQLTVDRNTSGDGAENATALHIDCDRTVAGTGTAVHNDIGIDLDVNSASLGTSSAKGMDIDVVGATSGTHTIAGLDITTSGATKNFGLKINNEDNTTADGTEADFINYSSAETADYFYMNTEENGETTLGTIDSGGTDGNIRLAPNGKLQIHSATGANPYAYFHKVVDVDRLRIYGFGVTDDYFNIDVDLNGATTISTVDDNAAVAHLTFAVDGNILLGCNPGGGIRLQENDASTFTPSAASDATTKTYVDTKYFFSQTMNYYTRFSDFDQEWLILNNESNYKLGGTDTSVDDTQTADINNTNQTIARSLWFIVPFNMTITHISGTWQDAEIDNHPTGAFHMGLWVVASIGTSGSTPTAQTGTKTFTLKYVTPTVSGTEDEDQLYAFYDASPSLTLSAGDAVWAGAYNVRNNTNNSTAISMSIWGYAT